MFFQEDDILQGAHITFVVQQQLFFFFLVFVEAAGGRSDWSCTADNERVK